MTPARRADLAYFAGVIAGIVFLAAIGALALHQQQVVSRDSDFAGIWTGARAIVDGHDPYDPLTWRSVAATYGTQAPDTDVYGYPRWVALALVPLALLPVELAANLWLVAGILLAVLALRALLRATLPGAPLAHAVVGGTIFVSHPGYQSVANGQWTFVLLAATSATLLLLRADRPRAAAVTALAWLAQPRLVLRPPAPGARGRPRRRDRGAPRPPPGDDPDRGLRYLLRPRDPGALLPRAHARARDVHGGAAARRVRGRERDPLARGPGGAKERLRHTSRMVDRALRLAGSAGCALAAVAILLLLNERGLGRNFASYDLSAYVAAARHLVAGEPLYPQVGGVEFQLGQPDLYLYPPPVALLFVPFLLLPFPVASAIWGIALIALPLAVALALPRPLPPPPRHPRVPFGLGAVPVEWELAHGDVTLLTCALLVVALRAQPPRW